MTSLLKSDNLQYNMLGRWVDGIIVSLTKCLIFQVLFFFMISCKILCKNPFNLFSYLFYKITKIEIKSFECLKVYKKYKKNNTWNIRLLVDDSFVPSYKQPSVIDWRIFGLKTNAKHLSWLAENVCYAANAPEKKMTNSLRPCHKKPLSNTAAF